jgi:hypothetical protein
MDDEAVGMAAQERLAFGRNSSRRPLSNPATMLIHNAREQALRAETADRLRRLTGRLGHLVEATLFVCCRRTSNLADGVSNGYHLNLATSCTESTALTPAPLEPFRNSLR